MMSEFEGFDLSPGGMTSPWTVVEAGEIGAPSVAVPVVDTTVVPGAIV
jgi:hypothetical protein